MKFTKANLAKTVTLLLCSTVLFCGCVKNSDVVIKVNDHDITRGEFYSDFDKIKNVQLKNAPMDVKKEDGYAVLSLKERFVNDIVMRELLNQEFEKRNITASDEEIKAKEKQIMAQIGSEEQFKNILKENNISDEKLKSDMAMEVKMDKLVSSLNIKDATDSEAQAFYNKNKERFNMPERVMASHILIDTNPESIKRKIADADKEAKLSTSDIDKKVAEEVQRKEALAKEVLAKAKANPKDFAKLAKEYSDDTVSAQKGGDLGFITRETVVKEFGDAAFSQKIGVVGPLVKSQYGQHIILVKDKAKAGVQPFSQVKNDLKAFLTQQTKMEKVQKFLNGLKNSAKIEYLDEDLNPTNLQKKLNEVIQKQIAQQQKANAPKEKKKLFEKNDNNEK